MTKQECKNLPTNDMFEAVLAQIALTSRELEVFTLYYRKGLLLYEIADQMCLDIQVIQRLQQQMMFTN